MKYFARIVLLSLWLFAIVAPSVITLIDIDNPVLVTNLNEEEQQESGKKSQLEEKMLSDVRFDFSLIALSKKSMLGQYHSSGPIEHAREIHLPPPEPIA